MQEQNKNARPQGAPAPHADQPEGFSWTAPAAALAAAAIIPKPLTQARAAQAVGIFAVGVVAGVLLNWGYNAATGRSITAGPNAAPAAVPAERGASQSAAGAEAPANLSFIVPTPQPAGTKVSISKAIVTRPTWIVVYESANGAPGRALGAALFSAQKQSGTVTLLRSTIAGKTYLVGQALDNGNKTFSLRSDTAVVVDGKRLLESFTAH